jgi:dienelactone hydrolase
MLKTWMAGLLGAAVAITLPSSVRAQNAREGLIEEPMKLAATVFRSNVNFDALIIRPAGPGPFPLAVITHGSIEDITIRTSTRPTSMSTPAYEMARRGWAAVSFMRLGYGTTGGEQLDAPGRCTNPQYEDPGLATAEQIRAAIEALRRQPFVDGERVVAMGVSAGGFGTLALTTLPVPGLRAVINFAGGRGSNSKGDVCSVGELTRAVGRFGSRAKVPSLWIYADNDKWFVPAVANTMFAAYAAGGSKAEKLFTPASGEDGHSLMHRAAHVYFWAPTLDMFLRTNGLPTWSVEEMSLSNQPGAGMRAKDDFARYLAQAGEKAFALSSSGSFGWRSGRTATEEAKRTALESCSKEGAKDCRLVFVNFERVK